jgi:formamidopyrimidine-DNA glycosylase
VPELPEVEVLVRHLRPSLEKKTIQAVEIRRARVLGPTSPRRFRAVLSGARFLGLKRRGKYLLFTLTSPAKQSRLLLVGHLGMTGRMYLLSADAALPKHAALVLNLGREKFVFEDTRYFGKLTLDTRAVGRLGPEPLEGAFTPERFEKGLKRSAQAIKVKLLDQSLVAGIGNIYASEALFLAQIPPGLAARKLTRDQVSRLWQAIRDVLTQAIAGGSSVALDFSGLKDGGGLFYYGSAAGKQSRERFRVYDRAGQPCLVCGALIKRAVHAARSTFYCPACQRRR